MLDLGDVITLTYPSKPASPATVTVTLGLPDGTTTSPVSAPSGTYPYTTTQAGRHTVLWVATGPSDAYSDSFDVAPQASATIISLADAKTHLVISESTNDDELRLFLSATTKIVERVVGPVISATYTEIVDQSDTIVLNRAPIQTLGTITTFDPVYGSYVIPTYILDGPNGILRRQPSWAMYNNWTWSNYWPRLSITYTVGTPIVGANIQIAARIILNELWASRRGAMALPARGGDEETIINGYALNDRARELLEPSAQPSGIG